MATVHKFFILATCLTSGLAVLLALLALGTDHWIDSEASYTDHSIQDFNTINYGLFKGVERINYGNEASYEIYMTCLYGKNVCALLCDRDSETRKTLLEKFYSDASFNETDRKNCNSIQKTVRFFSVAKLGTTEKERKFVNAGVQLTTILFLCLSVICGILATGLAVCNTIYNPIYLSLSVTGLFIYNGIAFVSTLLYVMLWGSMFASTLMKDIATQDNLNYITDTDGRANLGYSYWINLVSLLLYAVSIGLLGIRRFKISKDPVIKLEKDMENTDNPDIYLF